MTRFVVNFSYCAITLVLCNWVLVTWEREVGWLCGSWTVVVPPPVGFIGGVILVDCFSWVKAICRSPTKSNKEIKKQGQKYVNLLEYLTPFSLSIHRWTSSPFNISLVEIMINWRLASMQINPAFTIKYNKWSTLIRVCFL